MKAIGLVLKTFCHSCTGIHQSVKPVALKIKTHLTPHMTWMTANLQRHVLTLVVSIIQGNFISQMCGLKDMVRTLAVVYLALWSDFGV